MPKEQKQCELQCFGSWHAPKKQLKLCPKVPKKTSKKERLVIVFSFFPNPDPEKRETTRVKDFGTRSAAGARPRVATAMLQGTTRTDSKMGRIESHR